jgi:hypothetical protein
MSEMVERVARALALCAWKRFGVADSAFAVANFPRGEAQYCDEQWGQHAGDARAAIEVMQRPA